MHVTFPGLCLPARVRLGLGLGLGLMLGLGLGLGLGLWFRVGAKARDSVMLGLG